MDEVIGRSTRTALDAPEELDDLSGLRVIHPALVGDGERCVKPSDHGAPSWRTRHPERHHEVCQPPCWRWLAEDRMADRSSTGTLKKALDLWACRSRVTTRSRRPLQWRRRQPGPDRHPRLVFLVALGVAEIGYDGGTDAALARLSASISEQQLHEVVVRGERRSLDQEHVAARTFSRTRTNRLPSGNAGSGSRPVRSRGTPRCATKAPTGGPGQQNEVVDTLERTGTADQVTPACPPAGPDGLHRAVSGSIDAASSIRLRTVGVRGLLGPRR